MLSSLAARICRVCGKRFETKYPINFCGYDCYRKYKMPSALGKIDHSKSLSIINHGINIRDKQKIILHPSESLKHFLVKSLVCRILFERGRSFVCEGIVENGKKVDVCDLSMQIAYEIEPSRDSKRLDSKFGKYGVSPAIKDIIIIAYKEIPDSTDAAYEKLKELVV